MKRHQMIRTICPALLAAGLALLLSGGCANPEERTYSGLESQALAEWMKTHRPDLLDNLQENGGYYVDILDAGDETLPVNDTAYWVRLSFTGRDLAGNVCLTRDEMIARQMGSFTKYTHYVPLYRYCGEAMHGLLDGVHLALRNPLTVGGSEVTLGLGARVQLYLTSTIAGNGLSGSGGYQGQEFGGETYALSSNRPLIVDMEVLELVKNPLEEEGTLVDAFASANGTLKPVETEQEEAKAASLRRLGLATRGADEPQYNDGYGWRNAVDTLPHLYINHTYHPSVKPDSLWHYEQPYRSSVAPYNNLTDLDTKINQALIDRFGTGRLDGDSVKLEGTAKVWYIGRFLDGFIFDTNIDEVKELIYGEVSSTGSAYSVTPKNNETGEGTRTVDSWYYAVPQLRFGQWAAIMGTSTYNYGATGQEGMTTTSTTSSGYSSNYYYDMLNYYNYMNSYYGGAYYGGYYGNYYDYYNYGYYNDYYYNSSTTETVTTTSTSTEIQSYTPLLFQIYIEEAEE